MVVKRSTYFASINDYISIGDSIGIRYHAIALNYFLTKIRIYLYIFGIYYKCIGKET